MLLAVALVSGSAHAQFTVEAAGVLSAATASHLAGGVESPTLGIDGATGEFSLFFATVVTEPGCTEAFAIGHASSPDGIHWDVGANYTRAPNGSGVMACGALAPAVVVDGDTWHLYFEVMDIDGNKSMAMTRLRRGERHQRYLLPALDGLHDPTVAKWGSEWLMLGVDGSDDIVSARSTDGISWTVDPGANLPKGVTPWSSDGMNSPSVTCVDGPSFPWILHFGGWTPLEVGWAMAISDDATTWYLSPALDVWVVPDPAWTSWDVLAVGSEFVAVFEERDANGRGQIGFASTGVWAAADLHGRACTQ